MKGTIKSVESSEKRLPHTSHFVSYRRKAVRIKGISNLSTMEYAQVGFQAISDNNKRDNPSSLIQILSLKFEDHQNVPGVNGR